MITILVESLIILNIICYIYQGSALPTQTSVSITADWLKISNMTSDWLAADLFQVKQHGELESLIINKNLTVAFSLLNTAFIYTL